MARAAPLAALLFAAVAQGCLPLVLPRPAPAEGSSSKPPLARLGRFDGEGFVAVSAGSLAPAPVHVIVHGWAYGWIDGDDASPPRAPAWRARRNGERFEPWIHELARNIHHRSPESVVLVYDWLEDASTSPNLFAQRRAFARTDAHGRILADALQRAMEPGFDEGGGRVHLIGHSFGARVAAIAADELARPPRHLTLLDAPDTWVVGFTGTRVRLGPLLERLPIGRGPGQTFVDNYVSMFGVEYRHHLGPGVVDVQTAPPYGQFQMGRRHAWAADFYARTAPHDFGFGWSPLVGGSLPEGCFRQAYLREVLEPLCERRGALPARQTSQQPAMF